MPFSRARSEAKNYGILRWDQGTAKARLVSANVSEPTLNRPSSDTVTQPIFPSCPVGKY